MCGFQRSSIDALAFISLIACGQVQAQVTWDGSESTDWHTAANWVGDAVPTSGSQVVIGTATNQPTISTDDVSIQSLTVNDEGILTIASDRIVTLTNPLIVNAGGTLDLGDGTCNVSNSQSTTINGTVDLDAGDLTCTNGIVLQSGGLLVGASGTVSVTGNVTINSGATIDAGASTMTISGGDFVVNGTFQYDSSTVILSTSGKKVTGSSVDFYNLTFENGGTSDVAVEVFGTLTAMGGAVTSSNFTIADDGTIRRDAAGTLSALPTLSGTVSLEYIGTSSITSGNELASTVTNLSVDAAGGVSISSAVSVTGTLTLTSGIVTNSDNLTVSDGATIVRSGGALDEAPEFGGTLNLRYEGPTAISVATEMPDDSTTLHDLEVACTGGVTFTGDVFVNDTLNLIEGLLYLNGNILTLGSTAEVGGLPSETAMIVSASPGETRKQFSAPEDFTFPIGDTTGTAEYSPAELSIASGNFGQGAYASATTTNAKHEQNTSSTDYLDRYWTIGANGISSFECSLTLTYSDADVVGAESNIFAGSWSGASWILLDQAIVATNELTGTVTDFSDFTGGEQSALPVQLASLAAEARNGAVQITWNTAAETDNAGWEIERKEISNTPARTTDTETPSVRSGGQHSMSNAQGVGAEWKQVGFVEGAGTSTSPKEYSFEDQSLAAWRQAQSVSPSALSASRLAYRLKQLDRSGSFSYSDVVEVSLATTAPRVFHLSQNFPNPFNPSTTISYALESDGPVTLKVYDLIGREVVTLVNGQQRAGVLQSVSFDGKGLASGVYVTRLTAGGRQLIRRMVLLR